MLFPPGLLQRCLQGSVPAAFCSEVSHSAVSPGVNRQSHRSAQAAVHNPQSPGSLHKLARLCAVPSPVAPAHQWQHLSCLSSAYNNCLCPACDVMGTSVLPLAQCRCPPWGHCMGWQRCKAQHNRDAFKTAQGLKGRCWGCVSELEGDARAAQDTTSSFWSPLVHFFS